MSKQLTLSSILAIAAMASLAVLANAERTVQAGSATTQVIAPQEASLQPL